MKTFLGKLQNDLSYVQDRMTDIFDLPLVKNSL